MDCTSDTWEIAPDRIEENIISKTKAIIGVHLYGQPFEYKKIKQIAEKYNLPEMTEEEIDRVVHACNGYKRN